MDRHMAHGIKEGSGLTAGVQDQGRTMPKADPKLFWIPQYQCHRH